MKIGRTTIQTHFAAVDLYTRDLLRFGPEKAAVRNRLYRACCLTPFVVGNGIYRNGGIYVIERHSATSSAVQ